MQRSYHTDLKIAFLLGKLPMSVQILIPKSTLSNWRKESPEKYYTGGIERLDQIDELLTFYPSLPGAFHGLIRLLKTYQNCMKTSSSYSQILREHKEQIVKAVHSCKNTISLKKAIRLFGISIHTFYEWRSQVELPCLTSPIKQCKTRRTNQLTMEEVSKMEKLLTDQKIAHWSIASIHHYARRMGLVIAGLQTWYKYNQLMKWRKTRQKRKPQNYHPLRATRPNEYWHMDVTIFRTRDGVKNYIYALMDNFSRKVLSWEVSDKLSGAISTDLVRKALSLGRTHYPELVSHLIVDGGSENNNQLMEDFLLHSPIIKLVAQKDIPSSNSMVEAKNMKIKYECLHRKDILNQKGLIKELVEFFDEDSRVKPLNALGGYTPDEVYIQKFDPSNSSYHQELGYAQVARKVWNRANTCQFC